jgi:hypothetical protein
MLPSFCVIWYKKEYLKYLTNMAPAIRAVSILKKIGFSSPAARKKCLKAPWILVYEVVTVLEKVRVTFIYQFVYVFVVGHFFQQLIQYTFYNT